MIYLANNLIKAVVQFSANKLAGKLRAIATIKANFGSEHGRSQIRAHARFSALSGLRIKTRRHIDRNHRGAGLIESGNPYIKRGAKLTMEPRTENGVNYKVRLLNKLNELITRRPNMNRNVTSSSSTSNMTSQRTWNFIGIDGGYNVDVGTLLTKNVGGDPPITTVIAKSAKNQNALRGTSLGKARNKLSGKLHELRF